MAGFLTEPTRSEYDSSDVEGAFRSVIELLRTSHDREHGFDSEVSTTSAAKDSNAALVGNKSPKMALNDRIIAIECPSLSLRHLGHLNIGKNSRVQAEMESAALLARPLLVEMNPPPTENGSIRIDDLPSVLMNNLYESFAILVDSRLHVYSKIFFRHLSSLISKHADAFGILQMGQKLETLHDIGGQITASSMQVHTELHDVEPEEDSEGVFQQGFKLEAVMELHVPCPTGQSRTLVVRHSGEGCLRGKFVKIHFDIASHFHQNNFVKFVFLLHTMCLSLLYYAQVLSVKRTRNSKSPSPWTLKSF